jgi:hypothetical protein
MVFFGRCATSLPANVYDINLSCFHTMSTSMFKIESSFRNKLEVPNSQMSGFEGT